VILERNEMAGGPAESAAHRLAHVPSPATGGRCWSGRRRHLLRSANKDFVELKDAGKLHIISTPFERHSISRHERDKPPFDNPKVRQRCLRHTLQKIMDAVLFGLPSRCSARLPARRLTGLPAARLHHRTPRRSSCSPRPLSQRLETTLSSTRLAGSMSPLCVLTQESLAQIGIKCTINKIPGAPGAPTQTEGAALYTNVFSGWLDYPEYFFICLPGKNSIFNTIVPAKEMDAHRRRVTAAAEATSAYDKDVKASSISPSPTAAHPMFQPYVNVATQKNVRHQYWFHRRLDYRALVKVVHKWRRH